MSDMKTIREWHTQDGHTVALVLNGRREQVDYGEQPFAVLWLQNLDGELGKVKTLGDFATEVDALAFVRTCLAAPTVR